MLDNEKMKLNSLICKGKVSSLLIKPTKIYTYIVKRKSFKKIKGGANITGGGLTENIPRLMPNNKSVEINFQALKISKIFFLKFEDGISTECNDLI